ncbi:MAG: putative toxin-antitoxin system toxin component, PIN family [Chitinophagales bacterium]|nr:putative toxin-antitoxin system toxin component, PIN family [Chitinophagales bacterium]
MLNIFWSSFHLRTIRINVVSEISVCRDPKDNFLLALAKDTKADYLITGDKDLLELKQFDRTIICTLADFIKIHIHK